jgi:hypothetical protein
MHLFFGLSLIVDASDNRLHGTIPSSFGNSASIKDFRMSNNMLYDPIPSALCNKPIINGGMTEKFGCAGVLCPLGTYTEQGHAMDSTNGCLPCPPGESTLYLGSTVCRYFSEADILSLFYDVMNGERWPPNHRTNWRNYEVSVCEWAGVVCDENGTPTSLGFPLLGADDMILSKPYRPII